MQRNDDLNLPYFTDAWYAKTEVCNKIAENIVNAFP